MKKVLKKQKKINKKSKTKRKNNGSSSGLTAPEDTSTVEISPQESFEDPKSKMKKVLKKQKKINKKSKAKWNNKRSGSVLTVPEDSTVEISPQESFEDENESDDQFSGVTDINLNVMNPQDEERVPYEEEDEEGDFQEPDEEIDIDEENESIDDKEEEESEMMIKSYIENLGMDDALRCRSIRIGSLKVDPKSDNTSLHVLLSADAMSFNAPMVNDQNKIVNIILKSSDITQMLVHFGRGLPTVFVYTTRSFAKGLRKSLNMSAGDFAYFDPTSNDERQKKITFLIDSIKDDQRRFLRSLFLNDKKVSEIDQKTANEILVLSTPSQDEAVEETHTFESEIGDQDEIKPDKKKKKRGLEQRSEASQNISEFNLTEIGKEKIKLDELIKTSQKLSGQVSVKKQLENAKKLKSLSIPLSKPRLQKIKRTIAYEKVCDDVSKWDTIVKSNRDADQIIYPLKRPEFYLESFETASERFISKHPVEEAVAKILGTSENVLDQKRTLTVAEEKALQAMSLEEAKLRHSELMKHRALISYQEAKARRKNKIKSKRYHRILKREKLKKMMNEFESLQKTDQSAALEKFLEADKLRILERMTLKHRNTGKWAKQQKIRAKYNPESRSNLKEDILIGRQLREKVTANISTQPQQISSTDLDSEDKFFEDPSEEFLIEDLPFGNTSAEAPVSETNALLSKILAQEEENLKKQEFERKAKAKEHTSSKPTKETKVENEMAFASEATCLDSIIPDDITFGDEDLDDPEDGQVTIEQAFADEELVAEFQKEKKTSEKANQKQGIDLFLPGWGTWGGPGIKQSRKRRRRFFIKPLETTQPKKTLGNVIINEDNDKKAAEHQVSHLPFPFSNVHQFQSYIRQPIGNTWNPQSSFQNLITPKVITKMGKIIEPIDSEDVILEKKTPNIQKPKKRKKRPQDLKAF